MANSETLRRLEELFSVKEVEAGFPSQQACLAWVSKVAPLLRFNARYYDAFLDGSRILNSGVSGYTLEPTFRIMVNQVAMAIEELKLEEASAVESRSSESVKVASSASLFKFEPNFHGIGIDLHEATRRARNWWSRKKTRP